MLKRALLTACAVATTAGFLQAQQPNLRKQFQRDGTERAEEGALNRAAEGRLAKATDLIGTTVQSSDGQSVGEIKDIVIDTANNQVEYIVLESQSSTDGYLVMPWTVAKYGPARQGARAHIVVSVNQQRLRGAPVVPVNDFRTLGDAAWASKVNTFYQDDIRRPSNRFDRDGNRFERDRNGLDRDRRENVRDGAEDARERVRDRADDVREERRERVRDRLQEAKERADDVREDAEERTEELLEKAAERVDE